MWSYKCTDEWKSEEYLDETSSDDECESNLCDSMDRINEERELYGLIMRDDIEGCVKRIEEFREQGIDLDSIKVDCDKEELEVESSECSNCGNRSVSYVMNTLRYYLFGEFPYYECTECMIRKK